MKQTFAGILVSSTALWFAASAHAQIAAPPTAIKSKGLEEIVVTAQRVQKNLQKTPVAVTSFNAVALKQEGVTSLLNLSALAPNLSIGTRSGAGTASGDVSIRGIGIDANPPASPSVGVYIDDVYFPGSYGNLLGLFDVARVEVLRGPQGTLFGRNTIAGALQYVSVRPQLDKYGGFVEDTVGNLNRNDVSAGINIPIGSIAALRVSGGINDRNGYVHDDLNNIEKGADRTSEARVQLRIKPNADLTIDLKAEYVHDRSNGSPTVPIAFNYTADQFGLAYAPNGLDQYLNHGFYNFAGDDGPDYATTQFRIAQGVITYTVSDALTLKSITAGSANESIVYNDNDATPVLLLHVNHGHVNDRLFTQEVQALGTVLYNRLHYQVGGYFFDDHASTAGSDAEIGIKLPFPPGIVIPINSNIFGNYVDSTISYAAYSQVTFDITRKLAIVGGLRYTSEKALASDNANPDPSATRTFTDVSPMVGVNYQATPDMLFYFKDSRGFRAGGFSPNKASYNYFGPENATTYEWGARMQFLNRRLRINPTIFVTDWNHIQFNSTEIVFANGMPNAFPVIQNAGKANIKGAEVEFQAAVTNNFTVTGSGSLLDGHYTGIAPFLTSPIPGQPDPRVTQLGFGSGLKRSPQSAYTIGGRYEIPLPRERSITLSANYAWQAHQRSETTDNDNVPIGSYGILNARIDFKPTARLTLSGFATNLAGTKYYLGGTGFAVGGIIPTTSADIGPPREYGLTGRFEF